jgi:hypothetical protein
MLSCAGNVDNTRADDRRTDERYRVDGRVDDDPVERDRDGAPTYSQALARARASLADAEQAGAAEFGNAELARARDKLRDAERAAEDDDDLERAAQLAVEADLDADLAIAKTRNGQTQALVTEVRSGLRTLEDELRRNEANSVPRP